MNKGLIHLYWGEGKGKTTAAMGLALRALGSGLCVGVMQFLKSGQSGELQPLQQLNATICMGKEDCKFVCHMTNEEKAATKAFQTERLKEIVAASYDLLILDEACAAWQLDMIDKDLLKRAVLERPAGQEVVLTGREPADWMMEAADYCTEMRCHKHPYQQGIAARKGVEF